MSTEPNEVCKHGVDAMKLCTDCNLEAVEKAAEFLTEFCNQPPPETGAVDVESKLRHKWGIGDAPVFGSGSLKDIQTLCNECRTLRTRISELEKENERLNALLHEAVAQELPRLQEIQLIYKLTTAEARVKEMEKQLEGALKLTTANSIEHVSKLER